MVKLNDLTDRMEGVSYALYKSDNPDTRFEKIYQKLTHLEAARQKDIQSLSDQKEEVKTMLDTTVFNMEKQIRELDEYKVKYVSLGTEINEIFESNKRYMEDTKNKLNFHMTKTDLELSKMIDRLNVLEGASMNHKFDIDKLQASTAVFLESIRKNQANISQI